MGYVNVDSGKSRSSYSWGRLCGVLLIFALLAAAACVLVLVVFKSKVFGSSSSSSTNFTSSTGVYVVTGGGGQLIGGIPSDSSSSSGGVPANPAVTYSTTSHTPSLSASTWVLSTAPATPFAAGTLVLFQSYHYPDEYVAGTVIAYVFPTVYIAVSSFSAGATGSNDALWTVSTPGSSTGLSSSSSPLSSSSSAMAPSSSSSTSSSISNSPLSSSSSSSSSGLIPSSTSSSSSSTGSGSSSQTSAPVVWPTSSSAGPTPTYSPFPYDSVQSPLHWWVADDITSADAPDDNVLYWPSAVVGDPAFTPMYTNERGNSTLVPDAYNGHAAVSFDNSALACPLSTATTYNNITIVMTVYIDEVPDYCNDLMFLYNNYYDVCVTSGQQLTIGNAPYASSLLVPLMQPTTVMVTFSADSIVQYYIDGQFAGNYSTSGPLSLAHVNLGYTNYPFTGDIFEVLFFSPSLNVAQVEAVYTYLANKYEANDIPSTLYASDYGVSTDQPNNNAAMAKLFHDVGVGNVTTVVFNPGVYNVTSSLIDYTLQTQQQLEIVGNGATLLFTDPPGPNGYNMPSMIAFHVADPTSGLGTSLTIQNLTIDMLYPPYAQGLFSGIIDGMMYVRVTGNDPLPLFNITNGLGSLSMDFESMQLTYPGIEPGVAMFVVNSTFFAVNTTESSGLALGQPVVVSAQLAIGYANGLTISNVDTVLIDGVNVWASCGSGLDISSGRDVTVTNTQITRKPGRYMGVMRDVIPLPDLRGSLWVNNSVFGWAGDDIMNMNGAGATITTNSVSSNTSTTFTVSVMPWDGFGWNELVVGDTWYLRSSTGVLTPDPTSFNGLAVFTLTVAQIASLYTFSGSPYGVAFVVGNNSLENWSFERAINALVLIENSVFHAGRSGGIIPSQNYHTVIRNNAFYNLLSCGIGSYSDGNWQISPPLNLFIDGNTFTYSMITDYGPVNLYAAYEEANGPPVAGSAYNLSITNNYFLYKNVFEESTVLVTGYTNVVVANNTVDWINTNGFPTGVGFVISNCDLVDVYGNTANGTENLSGVFIDAASTRVSMQYDALPVRNNTFQLPLQSNLSELTTGLQATSQTGSQPNLQTVNGLTGWSLSNGGFIQLPPSIGYLGAQYTVSIDVVVFQSASHNVILASYPSPFPMTFILEIQGQNTLVVTHYDTEVVTYSLPDGYLNTWMTVAVTYANSQMALFVNGTSVAQGSYPQFEWEGSQALWVGYLPGVSSAITPGVIGNIIWKDL